MEAPVIVYACNWDGLSSVEAAARAGYCYPASVKLVRVTCLSRLNQGLILKPFELGAVGVMLLGCEPQNCQYGKERDLVNSEFERARIVLRMLGLEEHRLTLVSIPRGDGYTFVRQVTSFVEQLRRTRTGIPVTR